MRTFTAAVLIVAVPVVGIATLVFVAARRNTPPPVSAAVPAAGRDAAAPTANAAPPANQPRYPDAEIEALWREVGGMRLLTHTLFKAVLTPAQIELLIELAKTNPDSVPPEILMRELLNNPDYGPKLQRELDRTRREKDR
jgi:hypothetical protein